MNYNIAAAGDNHNIFSMMQFVTELTILKTTKESVTPDAKDLPMTLMLSAMDL